MFQWNAANILTVSRFFLTPLFIVSFVAGNKLLALIFFAVAGFTDLIDGTVARLLGQPSKGGALLDPLADKFLMQSCFAILTAVGVLPWWFFVLALARDIMIVAGIIYLEKSGASLPYKPVWASKLATLLGLVVAVIGLVRCWRPEAVLFSEPLVFWHAGFIIAAAVFIVVSGIQYVKLGFALLKAPRAKK